MTIKDYFTVLTQKKYEQEKEFPIIGTMYCTNYKKPLYGTWYWHKATSFLTWEKCILTLSYSDEKCIEKMCQAFNGIFSNQDALWEAIEERISECPYYDKILETENVELNIRWNEYSKSTEIDLSLSNEEMTFLVTFENGAVANIVLTICL